jgi:hypothetical protein
MEPNQPAPPQSAAQNVPPKPISSDEKPPVSKKILFIAVGVPLLLFVILLGIIFGGSSKNSGGTEKNTANISPNQSEKSKAVTPTPAQTKNASNIIVYGAWTGQTSAITAVDLNTSKNFLLATLPLTIKKVHVLSDNQLVYMDQVDNQERGTRIIIYNLQAKSVDTRIPASDGFFINDYILSPDKKYLVVWEIGLQPWTHLLQGGQSRVYAVDLSRPTVKRQLYDEPVNTISPVHYPIAILNDGTVFTDTYMANDPNGQPGWGYGLSITDFNGTNKRSIDSVTAGSYGSQPKLSGDGKYLLFAGYDGANGDGNAIVNGKRQSILTPNTVDLLNTQTLQRFRLPNIDDSKSYSAAFWDQVTGTVIIQATPIDPQVPEFFSYDLGQRAIQPISLPNTNTYTFLSQLPDGKTLIGIADTNQSNFGNLGDTDAFALTQLAIRDSQGSLKNIAVQDIFIQYITILPGTYFQNLH